MRILGIDCTTRQTNACVSDASGSLYHFSSELARSQASQLPIIVNELLSDSGLKISDIDLIAATTGPGYYTGIRTGVAYAAALAESLRIKIVPLSGMEMFIFDLCAENQLLASVLKARSESLYCALYASDGKSPRELISPSYMAAAKFAEMLKEYSDVLIVGDDIKYYSDLLSLRFRTLSRHSGPAENLVRMAEFHSSFAVLPSAVRGRYLREPDIGPTKR